MIFKLLIVAAGGALGTMCRFVVSKFTQSFFGGTFAWGTMTVNIIGCLVIGFLWSLSNEKDFLSPFSRLFFMVGFLGAFTTFSTYSLETMNFLRENEFLLMTGNIFVNNFIGFIMVIVGIWIARLL
jgi:CrcB protein